MSSGVLHVVPRTVPLPPALPLDEALRVARLQREALTGSNGYIQDALAVDFAAASDEQVFGPQRTVSADLPEPTRWSGQIALAMLEVMTGSRPATQVLRWTTPEVYAVLARRSARVGRRVAEGRAPRGRQRLVVVRVRVCEPADGVAEAAVIVRHGPRVRAVALRLVGQDGKWKVSALQVG
ncbi:Rv3235 family protein [Oryzobacter telluris]|uniref:Rv3235 family protein n=1 Tax=Oryzobacter telluris TaxID=3149179 RepID=UPI00370D5B13